MKRSEIVLYIAIIAFATGAILTVLGLTLMSIATDDLNYAVENRWDAPFYEHNPNFIFGSKISSFGLITLIVSPFIVIFVGLPIQKLEPETREV